MSASEHYLEAERLLDEEAKVYNKPPNAFSDIDEGQRLRELAYVHALLAQAGFTLAHK
jgi:hypothetical protein